MCQVFDCWMPPEAARVVAVTLALPWPAAALVAVELVIMPQSMTIELLPVAWMPVLLLFCRLRTQNSPEFWTAAAVALVTMSGAADMNMPLNDSGRVTPSVTDTWLRLLPASSGYSMIG